jgi:hypothetical protein
MDNPEKLVHETNNKKNRKLKDRQRESHKKGVTPDGREV